MYALIEFAGKQYKIEENCSIKVPKVKEDIGSKISFDNVLYIENGNTKKVGMPFVKGEKINGEVVSHGKERKIIVFKFRRRKGSQTKNTHRQEYSILKFGKLGTQKKQAKEKKAISAEKKKPISKKVETKPKNIEKE